MSDTKNSYCISVIVEGEVAVLSGDVDTPEELANWLLGEGGISGFLRGTAVRSILMPYFSE